MRYNLGSIKLYMRIKWAVLFVLLIHVSSWKILNVFPLYANLRLTAALSILTASVIVNVILVYSVRKDKGVLQSTHGSLLFDVVLIVGMSYIGGGIENIWYFLPIVIVVAAGFLFGMAAGYFYAAASFILMLAMILLEYYWVIPHLSGYGFSEAVWRNASYRTDYISGMLVLYFSVSTMIGYFKRNLDQTSSNLKKGIGELKKMQRIQMSVMEDLSSSKKELESKVNELENSRSATLHLLNDVEETRIISEKKAVEMEKLYIDLKSVDRMKNEFLSMVSHELRTPLTPIKGYASMLLSDKAGPLDDRKKQMVNIILKEGNQLLSIIDSILDVGRITRGHGLKLKQEPISIKALFEELRGVFGPELEEKGMKIEVIVPEKLPTIIGDPDKLRRVFTNLIGNAIKFTPKGGEIKLNGEAGEGTVKLSVEDAGVGISEESKEKIFDKFYQVDSSYTRTAGGVGLGLAIVKAIVEAHQGKIWVESEGLGKGSKFCIVLPVQLKGES